MVVESGVCGWSRETGDGSVMSQFLLPTLLEYIIKYGGPNFKLWLNYINNLLFFIWSPNSKKKFPFGPLNMFCQSN